MKKLFLLPFAILALAACSSTFEDTVAINSQPEGADVFLNSELIGQTPTNVVLPANGSYELKISKKGYKPEIINIASQRQNPFVKFGVLDDLGYYKELTPAPVEADMNPDFLPAYPGLKADKDFVSNVLKADQLRKEGKISQQEHSHLMKKIVAFYSQKK